jgi:hypothetical protein
MSNKRMYLLSGASVVALLTGGAATALARGGDQSDTSSPPGYRSPGHMTTGSRTPGDAAMRRTVRASELGLSEADLKAMVDACDAMDRAMTARGMM